MPDRRRRGGHGGGHQPRRVRHRPRVRGGGAWPEHRPARRGHREGADGAAGRRRAERQPRRRHRRTRASRTWTSMRGRASPSFPPATKSSTRAAPLAPGHIYDINKFTLSSVFAEHGGVPVLYRTAVDTMDDLSRAVDECLREDVLVFSGGSSVGERRPDPRRDCGEGRGALPRHRAETGQADGVRSHWRKAGVRHARLSDVVPDERLHPGGAGIAPHCTAVAARRPLRYAAARRSAWYRCRAAIRSTRSASRTAWHCRHSRRQATSRACPGRTATSRFPPPPTSSNRASVSR